MSNTPENAQIEASRNRTKAASEMLAFENPHPQRDYTIRIETHEFTCICPVTGHPDFASLKLEYIPDQKCVELKSYKLYLWSYREQGAYHEAVTNQILNDLVSLLDPRFMRLSAKFNVRGGVYTDVIAEHRQKGWVTNPAVKLP
ncbi:MAG: NADPH-dependent 7-cyano-7-deazaguanine reductase QueF [Gammaproteobacteria bacterium]|nr:preQ(1) synthase [Gammaproteobacteria bacterium]NNC98055.1 NADPH-dependent 7-cyano-7-deazaguanine reductase QueF [Gammaproteobacteria bacterium]NNM14605.1 NADPH-dependent 7-cyano-7-deazaguanine reductase QueF [Gammaproteobacteria bacterium]